MQKLKKIELFCLILPFESLGKMRLEKCVGVLAKKYEFIVKRRRVIPFILCIMYIKKL